MSFIEFLLRAKPAFPLLSIWKVYPFNFFWFVESCHVFEESLQLYYFLFQLFFSIMLFIYWDAKYEICIDSTLPATQQIVVSLGPMKWRLYEIPSVRLSVCQDFFWNCSFMHKIKVSSNFKSDTARLFEKNLVLGFGGKRALKWVFSSFMNNWYSIFFWF